MNRRLAGVSVGWLGISMVADGLPALLVPYRALAEGLDATALGMVTLVAIGTGAAAQPVAGGLSDRIGRAPVVGVGLVVAAGGLALVLQPGALLPGTVLALAGVGVAQAGYQALLPDRVGIARRGLASGAKGLFDVGGAFIAYLLLGWLLAEGRPELAGPMLIVGMVIFVAVGVALAADGRAGPARRRPASVPDGVPPRLVATVLARFLFLLGIFGVGRFLFMFMAERSAGDASAAAVEASTVLALLALVTAVAALPAGALADRLGRGALMAAGGVVAALGMAALAAAGSVAAVMAAGALMAIGSAAFGAGSWAMLADVAAGPRSGRLLGVANFGTAGAGAAAGLFGPMIDRVNGMAPGTGYAAAFGMAAALAAIGGAIGWWSANVDPVDRALEVAN